MTRIAWILTLVGLITGGTAFIQDYPLNLGWLFGADGLSDLGKQSTERSLCETSECVALAKMMTESMNPDVDPCENFYDYACGNWAKQNPLPKGEKVWSPLSKATAVVEKRLQDMLHANTKPGDFLGLKLARKAYNACTNTDELERIGLDSLIATIFRIGGWPMLMEDDEWDEELYTWQYVDDYYAGLIGENILHEMTVTVPWDWESKEFVLRIQDPDLPSRMYSLVNLNDFPGSDSEDDEGRNGSQERGSEERDDEDDGREEDREKDDDDEDTRKKRLIKSVKKRLRHDLSRYGGGKLSDEKQRVGQGRTKRAAIRSKVHYKAQHERSRQENRRVLNNKKMSRHRKISADHRVQEDSRHIYIDDSAEDEETDDDYYYYEDDDMYSGSGSGDGDEDDEDGGSGSGDGPYDDDETESAEKDWEEERAKMLKAREEFKEYVLNVTMALAEAMDVQIPKERMEKDVNDLLKFQLGVLKLSYVASGKKISSFGKLQKWYDNLKPSTKNGKIDWITKLKNVGTMAGLKMDGNTVVMIPSFIYFAGLHKLLNNTPSRTIVNYAHWNFISRTIKATTDQMADLYYKWNINNQRPEKRSDECMEDLSTKYFLGYEYIKRYFSDDWKKTAMDMIDDIQKEVEYRVKASTWMDDKTKEYILAKLVFMEKLIGYPPLYQNHTLMTDYYKGVTMSHSHFENIMSIMRHGKRLKLKHVNKSPENMYESYIDPLVVNAFYMPSENAIEITAADFQSPFYNPKQPWYTNFGIIGFIMAHEVNHGFDTMGRMFDRHGTYASWLSAAADSAYEKRADCFREQFTRYSMKENRTANIQIKNYGEHTSGENIADSMGLQAVFAAYQRRQRNCEVPDPMLPGFENFTNDQLFFLSTANVWCTVYDPDKIATRLKYDPHSLAPLRVIGSLSNSEDFAEAYRCPKGSPMNPEKKCNLWKASIGAVVTATPSFRDYPFGLESLFASKREVIAAKETKERSVCDSDECKLIAKTIKDSMDESVDPCEDFYQFACGKWDDKVPEPDSESVPSLWDMITKKIGKQVAGLMKSPIEPDDMFAVKLAKKWFKSCINREEKTLEPIVATLWRHGGWPLIMEPGEWNDRIYNWQIVDDQFARLTGTNVFFDMIITPLSMDGNETIVLDTPHMTRGIYRLLPEPYHGTDTSNENNESGEGSQEKGSKERGGPKNGGAEEDDEEDEGIEEDAEPEDEAEEDARLRSKVSRRRSHDRKLNHGRSRAKHSLDRRHRERSLGRRPTMVEEIVLRRRRSLSKRNPKHGVQRKSRKTGRKSSAHRHFPTSHLKKSNAGKSDAKRSGMGDAASVKKARNQKHAAHRNNRGNDEERNRVRRRSNSRQHGHEMDEVHGKRRIQHRVHHVARKIAEEKADEPPKNDETPKSDEAPKSDDEKKEDSSENKVDTGDEGKNGDDAGDAEDGGEDGKDDEEENGGAGEEEEEEEESDEEDVAELTEALQKYIVSVADTLSKVRGMEVSRKKIEKGAEDLVKFMIKLGEITLTDYDMQNMTLSEFQEWYDGLGPQKQNSKVNWKRKVQKLFTEAGVELDDDVEITLSQTEYFENVRELLNETPPEVIVNYIHWLFLSTVATATSEDLQELAKDWEPMLSSSREEECTQVELSDVIGYEYTKKHFPQQLERMARDMIDDIQKEVEYQIKESTWLDDDTKHFILSKLVHLQHIVGAPDWYQNKTMVQRYFQGLTIGPSYYENVLNYMRYIEWRKLRRLVNPDELPPLSMDPLMVNAFFTPTENVIAISAADLQNPFFATNRPWNSNFGIIGSVIAHEVNHGFDNSGHLYNRKGEPTEWLSAMATAYDKRAECFVRQFNSYQIIKGNDFKIKDFGNQTAGENIADTMGLEAVWRAYHRRLRQCNKPDPALPGLEKFDNNQTFFLSFANLWCEYQNPEDLKRDTKYDEHSPGRLRVIGSVSNMNGFAESFNCPAGSPMNPKEKCNIWL
ncbi:uncharacterized protein LOC117219826 [Megalopta genalis]|uniref:uncharacterized protein LOC117219826 n=1 Tax=Megalopta genalis TaxID=115081 RepID=UPI003FD5714F